MKARRRIHLAICGGGIGGLSLAVVLAKHCNDVDIDLFEALPKFTEIGAGISVWKRTWYIMRAVGLDATLGKMAVQPPVDELKPGFCFRKSDQEKEGFDFNRMIVPYGTITLHRADMLKVLTDNLPPASNLNFRVHFSKRLVSYTSENDSVTLHFADGTSAKADMLVGADGVKSATRAAMYTALAELEDGEEQKRQMKNFVQPSWSGTYGYRGLVETDRLLKASPGHHAAAMPMIYCGKDKHIVSYPISQGRLVNIVAFVTVPNGEGKPLDGPAVCDVSRQEVMEQYNGWEPEVHQLLDCIEKPSRWAISQVRGLPTYVNGVVALLGDSAHAMTTHLGAGAGQAIEDAYILGKLLSIPSVTTSNLSKVLKVYDAVRQPFGNHIVERSRTSGFLYEFNGLPEHIDEARVRAGEKAELTKLGQEMYKKWEVQWSDMPDIEWAEAEGRLKESISTSQFKTKM